MGPRLPLKRILLSIGLLIPFALYLACGSDETGIPLPGVLPDGAVAGDDDGAVDGGSEGGDDDADATITCPPINPDPTTGVFVSGSATNTATCGTQDAPCKTINFGITRAVAQLRPNVYVSRGTYAEHVLLKPSITVQGGWDVSEAAWTRACTTPGEVVVVRGTAMDNVSVEARDLGGQATLSLLRIESKLPATVDAGESLYGILAIGATTTLVLDQVDLQVGAAGPGATGLAGTTGANGSAGGCAAGTSTPGTAGTLGTGAPAGSFDQTGYITSPASDGTGGTDGDNGDVGAAGTCVQCGSCDIPPLCAFVAGTMNCGLAGLAGCGGAAGGAGGAGGNGGSAVGLFVWDATVQVTAGTVSAGNGGNGGNGGTIGKAGAGTAGAKGAASDACTVECAVNAALTCTATAGKGAGGAAGTIGAAAGAGGAGGGGAGGSSIGIFQGGAGVVTATGTTLVSGKAGKGGGPDGGAGANGAAADRVP